MDHFSDATLAGKKVKCRANPFKKLSSTAGAHWKAFVEKEIVFPFDA